MGYYFNTSEDLETGSLSHHQILGAKHGIRNGPPYPLGSSDHSSAEKKAAAEAGIKVGKDSGKGSIDNVKKKRSKSAKKKPLTPEEKRQLALDAVKSGDKKKIAKLMDQLSTDELRDAQARAQLKDSLTKIDPSEQKMSRAEIEKRDAMLSGDKEKVKQYAAQMTKQELSDAMEKVNLMAKLNYVEPPPTAMDKLKKFSESAENFRQAAEKGIGLYNLAAKVYNSSPNHDNKWPIIGEQKKEKEKTPEEKTAEALAKVFGKDVKNTAKENSGETDKRIKELQDQVNSLKNKGKKPEKSSDEANTTSDQIRKDAAEAIKSGHEETAKTWNRYADIRDEIFSDTKKSSTDHEYVKKEGKGEDSKYYYKEDTKKSSSSEAPSYDEVMTESVRDTMRRSVNSFNNVPSYDEIIPESVKAQMRETRFNMAMADTDYENLMDYAMRHSEV